MALNLFSGGRKMKKKIKELTKKECENICFKRSWCSEDCPLFATHKCLEFSEGKYEREVEVDD